ncbi:hypothetical protein BH24DEI2_BH24DEI2_27160 [soil metagenome]
MVDAEGNVVTEAENTVTTGRDCTGHAETNLMRLASKQFDRDFLGACILYTSTEPCVMCSGAIYWGNVRRVVFGLRESEMLKLTSNNPENPTLSLPAHEVFKHGQYEVEIVGPLLEDEARVVHTDFWS